MQRVVNQSTAKEVEIIVNKGDNFRQISFAFYEDQQKLIPLNITGNSYTMQAYQSGNVKIQFDLTIISPNILTTNTGVISLIAPGQYTWNLVQKDASGDIQTLIYGPFNVTKK